MKSECDGAVARGDAVGCLVASIVDTDDARAAGVVNGLELVERVELEAVLTPSTVGSNR